MIFHSSYIKEKMYSTFHREKLKQFKNTLHTYTDSEAIYTQTRNSTGFLGSRNIITTVNKQYY